LAISLLSIAAKMTVATMGHNFDVDSWKVVTGILEQGGSVYAGTDRWPYGPALFPALAGLDWIAHFLHPTSGADIHMLGPNTGEAFHIIMAAFLATIDVFIALALVMGYSYSSAMFFLLNPISLVISGFHSQVDNVAVFAALLAWLPIRNGKPNTSRWLASSVLLGLSLTIKHSFFFFPIWLVFWRPLGNLRIRLTYAVITYGLFSLSFLPWLAEGASRAGIMHNVVGYRSLYGNSLLGLVTEWFISIRSLDIFFAWLPLMTAFKGLWAGSVVLMGIAVALKSKLSDLLPVYLMALFGLNIAVGDQYLAIPMIAAAIYWRSWPSWGYVAAGSIGVCLSPVEFFRQDHPDFPGITLAGHHIMWANTAHWALLVACQVSMLGLLIMVWQNRSAVEECLSIGARSVRAALLCAVGCLPVLVPNAWRALYLIRGPA
jgi:hypothetical protein